MAKFKLELQLENKSWMTLTDYETGTPSTNISFDETLEENENDAYTLTFSVPEYLESGIRTGSLISIGRVLRLTFSNPERAVWFVVNNFQIGEGTENFIYSVSAQDYVSYVFSRNNAGLNLDTIEDQDFWEWMEEKYPAPNLIVPHLQNASLDSNGVYTLYELEGDYITYDSNTGIYRSKVSQTSARIILMANSFFDKGKYTFSIRIAESEFPFPSLPIYIKWGASELTLDATSTQVLTTTAELEIGQVLLINMQNSATEGASEIAFTLQLEKGDIANPVHVFAGADNFSPTTVTNIGNYILERGWLKRKNSDEDGTDWKVFCKDKTFGAGKFHQYNISVSDSNTYNALVELANISDTFMRIDYENRIINFIHRDNYDGVLDQNYTLKEGFNLLQSDVAYDGESLYGMFYINGGTDENDEFVTLSDQVRQNDNFLFDFSYFQEKGIISEQDLIDINLLIYGGTYDEEHGWQDQDVSGIRKNGVPISTRSLYSINNELQPTIARKYELEGIINGFYTQIIIAAEALMPEGNLASDFPEKYKLLQDKFTSPSENSEAGTAEFTRDLLLIYLPEIDSTLAPYTEYQIIFPLTFHFSPGERTYIETVESGDWITIQVSGRPAPIEYYQFRFSFVGEAVEPPFYSAQLNFGPLPVWIIWREEGQYPRPKYLEIDPEDFLLTHLSYRVLLEKEQIEFLIKTYAYYESLFLYDGSRRIQEEKQKFIDRIKYFKSEWLKDAIALKPLELIANPDANQLAEIKGLRSNIDNYRIAIGDYTFNQTKNTLTPNFNISGQRGFYQVILDMFNLYEMEFYQSLTWEEDGEIKTDEILETKPTMDIYRDLIELKKTFWFNMKENYGRNIFSEGYYDNEIEVSSLDLRAQAELIYKQHKKPNEDFSITYVNMSDVLGVGLQEIKVGDYIKINKTNIKLQTLDNTFLQVSAISRTLRSDADISLTITKYNMINSVIEKIVARSQ